MPENPNAPADQDLTPREQRLEEILAEYFQAAESGQSPDRGAFAARYPEFSRDLAEFFADQAQFERAASPYLPPLGGESGAGSSFGWGSASGPRAGSSFDDPTRAPDEVAATARGRGFVPQSPDGRLGDYELLEEIARGGMGVVYKARQLSLNRVVALKMILAGQFASSAEVQRFRIEAENAANLDHPGIVPIYEVGQYRGQHYFSMRLVEGGSLARQIDRFRDDLTAGVKLLASVACAVHYAHQRGILHRDLKPGNILLDHDGRPLVSDFGLARRIEAGSGLTLTGMPLGSPSYMAPEQAQPKGDLSTAADVYSLGAILYELLTGRPPFRGQNLLDTLMKVREAEPVPPRSINPKVPVDLETICLKCLRKDPQQRYAGADALADELRRYLNGEPIQARPVGPAERAWRWCRRKPAVAAAAALAALTTLATVVTLAAAVVLISGARERAETLAGEKEAYAAAECASRKEAEGHAGRAIREARRAKAAAFLQARMLDAVGLTSRSAGGVGGDRGRVRVADVLAAAARALPQAFPDDPATRATAEDALGWHYFDLDMTDEAEAHLRAALATRTQVLGVGDPEILDSMHHLAHVLSTRTAGPDRAERLAEAEALFRQAAEGRRASLGDANPLTRESLLFLADTLVASGKAAEAVALLDQTLTARLDVLHEQMHAAAAPDPFRLVEPLHTARQADPDLPTRAAGAYRAEAARREQAFGPNDPRTLAALYLLAALNLEDVEEAERLLRRVAEGYESGLGVEHPFTLYAVRDLAKAREFRGDVAGARDAYAALIEARTGRLGAGHPATLLARSYFVSWQQGRLGEGDPPAGAVAGLLEDRRRLLDDQVRELGPEHPYALASRHAMAGLLVQAGRFDEAARAIEETAAAGERAMGPQHAFVRRLQAQLVVLGAMRNPMAAPPLAGMPGVVLTPHPIPGGPLAAPPDATARTARAPRRPGPVKAAGGQQQQQPAGQPVRVTAVQGLAQVRSAPDQPWRKCEVGMDIPADGELRTGPRAKVELRLPQGGTVTLDRLGTFKLADALDGGARQPRSELILKYGQTRYEVEGAELLEQQTIIRSPSSGLNVRG